MSIDKDMAFMINMLVFVVTIIKLTYISKPNPDAYIMESLIHIPPPTPGRWLVLNINHPNKTALQKRSTALKSGYGGSKKKQGKRMPDL